MPPTPHVECNAASREGSQTQFHEDSEPRPYWETGTQYPDSSPIIRYGTLPPEEQERYGRRSWNPDDSPSKPSANRGTPSPRQSLSKASNPTPGSPATSDRARSLDPFVVPSAAVIQEQRVVTELQLVDLDIQVLKDNLITLKRKHTSDVDVLEDNIRALKKKRDRLRLLNVNK
ncbi:hypothetical protein NMY22_g6871 [Coprinellus aureogranulatus]|nr:hypothetical protein NMY22_g6871 [Coprinellus aureogranulatus]